MKKLYVLSVLFFNISAFGDIVCNVDVTDYHAIYNANQYMCNEGYYLPAGATSCVACPSNGTCSGGIFYFNPDKFQGLQIGTITNTSMNNVCADNFPVTLTAVYEPNSISLTWQDENGTTVTTNSCTYGTAITLPQNPTKPGYKFTGWKVENN